MPKTATISLRHADVRALRMQSSGVETLRVLAGPGARPLGHDLTADYAFLAADCSAAYAGALQEAVRCFVLLPGIALIDFDIVTAGDAGTAVTWTLEGNARPQDVTAFHRRPDDGLLHVIWLGARGKAVPIDSIDLAGVRIGDRVVAFHTESRMERSAVSFDVDGSGKLKILVAGMAPGDWEVWFGGMLEIPESEVRPQSGVLTFDGNPGSYFLRHL